MSKFFSEKIKIIVIDNTPLREVLVRIIKLEPDFDVIASFTDAADAKDTVLKYRPDVLILNAELPKLNGFTFLKQVLPQCKSAALILADSKKYISDALNAGASEYSIRPVSCSESEVMSFVRNELSIKIKMLFVNKKRGVNVVNIINPQTIARSPSKEYDTQVIAIGASTGGTEAIINVVREFYEDIPGVLIVQHMPPRFTAMYAERLDKKCLVRVKEARTGDVVTRGRVLIAPGDAHMRLIRENGIYKVDCRKGEKISGHCPSVDVLFDSVARIAGSKAIGVILTGMGSDGAEGLLRMRRAGAITIGQDEMSCVVYGMPKVAYDIGAVMYQLNLFSIPGKIYSLISSKI